MNLLRLSPCCRVPYYAKHILYTYLGTHRPSLFHQFHERVDDIGYFATTAEPYTRNALRHVPRAVHARIVCFYNRTVKLPSDNTQNRLGDMGHGISNSTWYPTKFPLKRLLHCWSTGELACHNSKADVSPTRHATPLPRVPGQGKRRKF